MNLNFLKASAAIVLIMILTAGTGFSQIDNVYAALLLKPGHVYLSSNQLKVNAEKPNITKSLSLEKNTRYAFSVWAKEDFRNHVDMKLFNREGSLLACLNPAYQTSKGVRYFYYTPAESGLYNITFSLHKKTIVSDVYLIQGLFFTEPELKEGKGDKRFVSPYCESGQN
jgi:hypothetical protein